MFARRLLSQMSSSGSGTENSLQTVIGLFQLSTPEKASRVVFERLSAMFSLRRRRLVVAFRYRAGRSVPGGVTLRQALVG